MEYILPLLGLTLLQIVLGFDNVIFISILTQKLDNDIKEKIRRYGLIASLVLNSVMIYFAGYLIHLHTPLFTLFGVHYSYHNFIMLAGGAFLIYKSIKEIHEKFNEHRSDDAKELVDNSIFKNLIAVISMDMLFSVDSTITAVGMTDIRWIQIVSVLIAIVMMFLFFKTINRTVEKYKSIKMLSLLFLFLIGFSLGADGLGIEISKSYIYVVMISSLVFEILNIRYDKYTNRLETIKKFKNRNK